MKATTARTPPLETPTVGPTVAELVATPTLGMTLVAGAGGVGRRVSWAHVSELLDPTPWLQGSELLMTIGLAVPQRAAEQRAYVRLLDAGGVAALAISDELFAPPISKAMRDEADARGFPVITVSLQVPFIAIAQEVAAHTQVAAQARLATLLRLFGTLRNVAAEELGNRELFARLEELSGYQLAVCSRAGRPLIDGVPAPPSDIVDQLPATDESPPRIADGYAVTLPAAGQVHGYLVATPRPGTGQMGLAAVQHIATIAALQIATRLRDYESRRREGAETLAELLAGTLDPGAAANRLELAGFADGTDLQLVAVVSDAGSPDDQAVARTLYELGEPHLMLFLGELYVLIPEGSPALEAMSSIDGVRLGVSRGFAAAAGFATARREARWASFRATDLNERIVGSDDDRDIGWLPAGAAAQREVVERILGPAIEYDQAHRAELVRSVEVWLAQDRSTSRAARALHLHPNTLAYRLRRFAQLTGQDLTSIRDLVDVWLALRVWQMLERPA
jgi:PucR family transcriptional regulator, purine catabolism regulatory protein